MGKRLPVVLDRAEAKALKAVPNIKCPTGLRNRAILEAMHGAGLRVSEVVNLEAKHIRWESGTLEVHDGKGGKDRNVPAGADALGWLSAWGERRGYLPGRKWFFCTLKGGRLSPRYLQQLVKRCARKAGLSTADKVTPHTLRHTYATELLDEGFTIRQVQELLGHASIETTSIYTHVRPGVIAEKIKARDGQNAQAENVQQIAQQLAALSGDKLAAVRDALAALAGE